MSEEGKGMREGERGRRGEGGRRGAQCRTDQDEQGLFLLAADPVAHVTEGRP